MAKGLGRRVPTDFKHVEKYPLRAVAEPPAKVPVVLGVNWYRAFSYPELDDDGTYWIGRGDFGPRTGGHAICAKPIGVSDSWGWYLHYDQGQEGACVGFACARMMTLLNRKRYDASWLYQQAQLVDEWDDTPPAEGSSVRAGCDVLRSQGAKPVDGTPDPRWGIAENRWATSWDEVRRALGLPDDMDGVPLLNSWGSSYPHKVKLTDEAGARLLDEYGEACLVTDR